MRAGVTDADNFALAVGCGVDVDNGFFLCPLANLATEFHSDFKLCVSHFVSLTQKARRDYSGRAGNRLSAT